jgi:hypothetical protein
MDIHGAFNATSTKILATVMEARKMPLYWIRWVKEMDYHRDLSFSFDDRIEPPKPISDVLPQVSPSSPILVAIMAAAIMEIPPPRIILPFGFGKHEKPQRIISDRGKQKKGEIYINQYYHLLSFLWKF